MERYELQYTGEEIDKLLSAVPVKEITWAELKTLRDNAQLNAGQWYRITDYQCTTTQENTQSAGHQFDILVRADSGNVLNENAYAAHHEGDTYFADCKLEAWQLKYCIDNDANRFAWADSTNGKGVIYYMKDEWGNECPYDFKNIMFKRYRITACEKSPDLIGLYGIEGVSDYTVDDSTPYWCYTFCVLDVEDDYAAHDVSVEQELYPNDEGYYNHSHDNVFKPFYISVGDDEMIEVMVLPYNVCVTDTSAIEDEGAFYAYHSNTFGNSCYFNTFGNGCGNNTFGNYCYSNTFGNSCCFNTFGNSCCFNTFGNGCYFNTFGNSCYNNTFGNGCYSNTFGNYCYNNTFGNSCCFNTFGNGCGNNTFGNDCYSNTFGNYCSNNTFGDYIRQLTVFEGVQYCSVTGGSSDSAYVRNAQILNGTKGTDESNLLTITFVANVNYTQIAGLNSSDVLKIWTPADLVQ